MSNEKQTDLIEVQSRPVESQSSQLLQLAIDKDLDVDKLERLIQMKREEDEREAKQLFYQNFAKMQAEFTPVGRSKEGYGYKYAPLELLQTHYNPTIAEHGFGYDWREDALPDGGKRTILCITGYGYAKENYFDTPPIEGTNQMNPIQVAGAMSTYGRRYTFIAGFGIIIEDEDQDGKLTMDDGVEYGDYIKAIESETDVDALYATVKGFRAELKQRGDDRGVTVVTSLYTKRKEEIARAAKK